jgi:outer membrane protein TolC
MKRLLLVLALAAAPATAQNKAAIPADLTLKQALDIALTNNSMLKEAQGDLQKKSGEYEISRSVLLPDLRFRAHQHDMTINLQGIGIGIEAVPGVIGPFGSMDARLILTQDLLNIAGLRSWQSYSSRRDSSRLNLENAREVVTLNVVGAYLQALRAKSSRDTLNEQTKLATELYDLTAARFRQGASSELDANRAKQQVNSLEQQRQEAEQSYVATKLDLAELLQAAITADFEVTDQAAYGSGQTMDRQATVQAALTGRPDYRAWEATVRAAELRIKAIKATRLPTIQLLASDGQSGNSPVHNVNTYTLGGSVEIPVLTSGRISGEVREAEGSLIDATAALDKSRAQIESDVLTAISGVEWALKEFQTSAENVGLSRQEVDLTRARFLGGVADNTEVVNAQDRLTRANDARIRAQFTLGVARANLARAVGGAERAYRK